MDNEYLILKEAVENTFERVVWSHKIQEKQADIYLSRYKCMITLETIVASATSALIVYSLFEDEMCIRIISAILSFISVFINVYFKSFNLPNMISSHNDTAKKLLVIRDELEFLFMLIELKQNNVSDLTDIYQETIKKLHDVHTELPRATYKAVEKAETEIDRRGLDKKNNKKI